MKKKHKIIIITTTILIVLFLLFIFLSFMFTKGYFRFRSLSAFKLYDKLFVEKIYYPLRLESIIGDLDNIRFVFNFPSRYYFLKDNTKSIIPLNSEQGQHNPGVYYDYHTDCDFKMMKFATQRMGAIYDREGIPFLYTIDYDRNLLFASCKSSILNYFEKINRMDISNSDYNKESEISSINEKLNKLVLLKIGNLWNGPYYDSVFLKLYGDGEIRFNYVWYNGPISQDRPGREKNIVSFQIQIEKSCIRNYIKFIEISKIDKVETFETKNPWNLFGLVVMVVKNKNRVKILYRDPNSNCFNNMLNKYWAEILSKTKLKENLDKMFREQANISLDQLHMNHIINMLSLFNN